MTDEPETGLLPPSDPDDHEWLRPKADADASDDEKVGSVLQWVADVSEASSVVWPARIDGELKRPPDDHLLDRLVRGSLLEDPPEQIAGELFNHPQALTVVAITELPQCDFCGRPARYDAPVTKPEKTGVWANACLDCYSLRYDGRLGSGCGQYLITWDEVSDETKDRFVRARDHWSGRGVKVPDFLPWD